MRVKGVVMLHSLGEAEHECCRVVSVCYTCAYPEESIDFRKACCSRWEKTSVVLCSESAVLVLTSCNLEGLDFQTRNIHRVGVIFNFLTYYRVHIYLSSPIIIHAKQYLYNWKANASRRVARLPSPGSFVAFKASLWTLSAHVMHLLSPKKDCTPRLLIHSSPQ